MATFGRKKGAISSRSDKKDRDSLKKLLEEEAERERFAEEFEEKEAKAEKRRLREAEEDEREQKEQRKAAEAQKGKANPVCFLDIEVHAPAGYGERHGRVEASGRLEIELFADVVPRTAENFRCLCTGEKGRDLSFKGCEFHRIIPGFMAQGGDITHGDGTGGRSIYGPSFADESFARLHARANILSMANSGPNTTLDEVFFFFSFFRGPEAVRKLST